MMTGRAHDGSAGAETEVTVRDTVRNDFKVGLRVSVRVCRV